MTSTDDLAILLHTLGFGPRLQRILSILAQHAAEWEHDPNLELITFRVLDRGCDASRVTYRVTSREQLGRTG